MHYQPLEDKCIDFSIIINNNKVIFYDSIGSCTNDYWLNTSLTLPVGLKTITFKSDSLNFIHTKKAVNLLYIWEKIEIYEYVNPDFPDSIIIVKELEDSYSGIEFI